MPKVFSALEIDKEEKELKKDYFDRHMPVIICEDTAVKNRKFKIKVRVGTEYSHPDDPDHHISYVQLWNRETLLAEVTYSPGTFGNEKNQVEVDFYIIPVNSINLSVMSYCSKHGLWQSIPKEVKIIAE